MQMTLEGLRQMHGVQPEKAEEKAPRAAHRTNKFGGKCKACGVYVQAEQGRIAAREGSGGGWDVFHIEGQCPAKQPAAAPKPEAKPEAKSVFVPLHKPVPEGRFTIVFSDGDYRTLRVREQAADASFMPGVKVVSYLSGPNNDSDYTSFAHITDHGIKVWSKHASKAQTSRLVEALCVLSGDPVAALKAYGKQSGNCGVCNRTLTTPESIEAGIGPVCAQQGGF